MASESEIDDFLLRFKFFAQNVNCFTFVEREKSMLCLAILGISAGQALVEVILQLTHQDYVEGPLQDRKFPNQNLWVFGYVYENEELYIKLSDNFSKNISKCLSFHKSESPLNYPFKKVS